MKLLFALYIAVATWATAAALPFVHPGALNSKEELDYVKAKIQTGAQPWKAAFELLKSSNISARAHHGQAHIDSTNHEAKLSEDDANAAYGQALLWYFTGEEAYAQRSIAILNAWAGLENFTGGSEQDRLQAGWLGAAFASAAEIMRLYPGWSPNEIRKFQEMFKKAFYPQLNTASIWNGNVDLAQIDAMMAIAVFNEDEAEVSLGLARLKSRNLAYFYLTSDGPRPAHIAGDGGDLNKFWHRPSKWINGLTQETCRDNGHHTQQALGYAIHAAEVAWHQGVDVYSENQERYTAAMELLADQIYSSSMHGLSANNAPTAKVLSTWEVAYNHYHNRAGVALPATEKLIVERLRPSVHMNDWNPSFETLTHAELPSATSPCGGAKVLAPPTRLPQ